MPAPKRPNTVAAAAARRRIGEETMATKLREAGWLVISPEALAELPEPGYCWAVVFSNYEPAEVDNLFATKALAEERAEQLGGEWSVERWAIQGWRDRSEGKT